MEGAGGEEGGFDAEAFVGEVEGAAHGGEWVGGGWGIGSESLLGSAGPEQ